ncbi:TetR/AcrR family transcriptional regulator [Flexibacterium corallicola]|uniref:TetR/AcrR family transcriptional regulator n=1 Tax=Flexibacterium corallicola TaxID=3037259 RepID=UPI00286ED40F|nr:TetR/AcrR family transcriptional regulator [Pseudovibrio sp. M1P-2-3]
MAAMEYLTVQGRAADVLEAARKSFLTKGYKGSAIAKIAETSDISMAHIYNFYPSKMDLACAVVGNEVMKMIARLENAADHNASATDRLKQVLLFEFQETFRLLEQNPGLASCMQAIASKRRSYFDKLRYQSRPIIETVLRSGNFSEEFDVQDVRRTSKLIHFATTKFRYAQLFGEEDPAVLREECTGVVMLILKGLEKRL